MTPDWESVGWESKYSTGIFSFLKKNPSLISLILNTKSEKHEWGDKVIQHREILVTTANNTSTTPTPTKQGMDYQCLLFIDPFQR